jgi:PAS domain S-box-containing protein
LQEEAVGKPLEEVFVIRHVATGLEVESPVRKVLREGRIVGLATHTRLIATDGRQIPIDDSAAPIRNGDRVAGVVLVFRDITERLKSEERMRLAVEAAPNAMIMVGSNGRVEFVNSQTEKLFGYSRDELLGQSVEVLVPERYRAGHDALRASFLREPLARPMGAGRDLYGLRKDGTEVPIEIGLNPITTGQGDFVLAAIIDISSASGPKKRFARRTMICAGRIKRFYALTRTSTSLPLPPATICRNRSG